MKKREFLRLSGIVGAGIVVSPFLACDEASKAGDSNASDNGDEKESSSDKAPMTFELPALGYSYTALAPAIDAETMEIHHSKHHAGYVRKLNNALKETSGYGGMSLDEIVMNVNEGDTGVRNNGGGHWNHSMFWDVMKPGGASEPSGKLKEAMMSAFGSLKDCEEQFFNAAKGVFGSGWAWICANDDGSLFITSTENQDNPMMKNVVEKTGRPILGIDVWEHAYYLNYQNERGEYIKSWMDLINWDVVAANYDAASMS